MFAPVAFLMGVEVKDVPRGVELVANEFFAYTKYQGFRELLSPRTRVLATYALTGFANFASIGIQVGGIGAIAPGRPSDLARLGGRALLTGFLVTLINASIAGLFVPLDAPQEVPMNAPAESGARLLDAARAARENAHTPFSNFKVGAALETADGVVVTGCNVENATYGLTLCAERVAVFKAVSEGHRKFVRVAVVADTAGPTPPCGACRQILWEFGGDLEVILGNLAEEKSRHRLKELLPYPFDARFL